MKYISEIRKEFSGKEFFSIRDLRIFLSNKKISKQYLKFLIYYLMKKNELKRISKGIYTFKEEMQVVGFAFQPFYYGLQDALSLHNIWEQETNPIVITLRKVRSGKRIFLGNNYIVKRINRKMFFGFEIIKYYDFWIPVSDLEKTIIDFVYFKEHISENVIKEIKKKVRKHVIEAYLEKCDKKTREKVLKVLNFSKK